MNAPARVSGRGAYESELVVFLAACAHAPLQRFTAGDTMLPTFPIDEQLVTKVERP